MAKLMDDFMPEYATIDKTKTKENKRGFVDTTTYDDDTTPIEREQPSAMKLMLDDSISEIEGYDPEAASIFRQSQGSLGPNSQPSAEAAMAADEEALEYYRKTVMPEMSDMEKKAKEIKGRKVMSGIADYVPLIAASLALKPADATLFINSYMQAREKKFQHKKEMDIYDLETKAKALERTMKLHEMTSSMRHRAYDYSRQTWTYIQKMLEDKKKEFAIEQTPAIEHVATTLGHALFQFNMYGGTPVDLSQETVLSRIAEFAKKSKMMGADQTFAPSQARFLYGIAMTAINDVHKSYMKAYSEKLSKAEKPVEDVTAASWFDGMSNSSQYAQPYSKTVETIRKSIDKDSSVDAQVFASEIEKIGKNLETHYTKLNRVLNDEAQINQEKFNSIITSIASTPVQERKVKLAEIIATLRFPPEPIPHGNYQAKGYGKFYAENILTEAVTELEKLGANSRKRFDTSGISHQVNNIASGFIANVKTVFNELDRLSGEPQSIVAGMDDPVNQELAFRIVRSSARQAGNYKGTLDDLALLLEPSMQESPEFKKAKAAYVGAKTETEKAEAYYHIYELLRNSAVPHEITLLNGSKVMGVSNLYAAVNKSISARTGSKIEAEQSKALRTQLKTALDAVASLVALEESENGLRSVINPILSIYNGTDKSVNEYVFNQLFPDTSIGNTYLRILLSRQ